MSIKCLKEKYVHFKSVQRNGYHSGLDKLILLSITIKTYIKTHTWYEQFLELPDVPIMVWIATCIHRRPRGIVVPSTSIFGHHFVKLLLMVLICFTFSFYMSVIVISHVVLSVVWRFAWSGFLCYLNQTLCEKDIQLSSLLALRTRLFAGRGLT